MKRRWLVAGLLLAGALAVAAFAVYISRNAERPENQPTTKADEADRRIDELIAELHGMRGRGFFSEAVQSPRFWEVVHELQKQQDRLGPRRSPVAGVLIDFVCYLPEDKQGDADRRRVFAALVQIDPQAPQTLIALWLWENKISFRKMESLGPALVPALVQTMEECKLDDARCRDNLAILLPVLGTGVLPRVRAVLTRGGPGARLAAVKTLAALGRQGQPVAEDLKKATHDENPQVRRAALDALGN